MSVFPTRETGTTRWRSHSSPWSCGRERAKRHDEERYHRPSCVDAKHAAFCDLDTKKIVVTECATKGCYSAGGADVCDPWLRVEGGKCTEDGTAWCSGDGGRKNELWACRGGVFHLRDRCTGPRGCSYGHEPGLMGCDVDTGREGDNCENRDRCDESRKRWLACENEKLVVVPRCRCAKDGKSKECDP